MVCADHGEEFYEHGGWYHGVTLYEEQLRVPLVVRLPRSELGGMTEERWVGLIDIAPTLARLVGADIPEGMSAGHDLFNPAGDERVMFSEENHEGNRLRSVRYRQDEEEWKLIEANPGNPRGLDPRELYELGSDPEEENNRAEGVEPEPLPEPPADQAPPAPQTPGQQLARSLDHLEAASARAAEGAARETSVDLTGTAAEQLRAIGYMEEDEESPRTP